MYPINANDVYRYVIRGLISSRYGKSPFEYAPAEFGDALYPLLAGEWRDATSPYGPIWELFASTLTSIGQDNFLVNIILFKLVGLLSLLGAGIILWMLFSLHRANGDKDNDRRMAFTILWVWNPALLLSFVGNAHNDAVMILILLAGWFVMSAGHRGPGFLILLTAALVKPIALLVLPIVFMSTWRDLEHGHDKILFSLWAIGGGIALLFLSFLPFGNPAALGSRLLQEASAGASFSPLTLMILAAWEIGWSASFSAIANVSTIIFLVFFAWMLWRTWRGAATEQSLAAVFWGYVFQALNFRIWYAIWPFPWLLLDAFGEDWRAYRRLHAGLWFLVTSQLSVILYGHIRAILLGGNQLLAHLIAVPFVFLLPFILARFAVPKPSTPDK